MNTLRSHLMWAAVGFAAMITAPAAVHAAGPNAFEFRRPSDNAAKAVMDNNGNVIFQGSGTFQASGAAQYSVELSSGIRLNAGCLRLADGTVVCDAGDIGGGGGSVFISSVSANSINGSRTDTAFSVCVATLTITTGGSSRIEVAYSGAILNNLGYAAMNFLLDGAFVRDYGGSYLSGTMLAYSLGNIQAGSWVVMTDIISSGSHSICLQLASNGGTTQIGPGMNALARDYFSIREAK